MNVLEKEDPVTWNVLKQGNFCVKKSSIQFSALFSGQGLEQWIKDVKGVVVGIT